MNPALAAATAVADRVNPIVVKELRQAVRSRFVIAILMLFLLVNLSVIGVYVMFADEAATSSTGGRDIFMWLLAVLAFTCICMVPIYASVRLAAERNDTNTDLLFATTIKPAAIIRGKFWAAMAMAVLIYSCCMPFLSVTYLLRGIDLPTIFFLLGMGLICIAAAVMAGILVGALPVGRIWRIFLGLGLFICLVIGTLFAISAAGATAYLGLMGTTAGAWEFWAAVGTGVLMLLAFVGLLYVLAVAAMSPSRANRTMPIRVYVTAAWIVLGVVACLWSWQVSDPGPVEAWVGFSLAVASGAVFLAIAERESWSPRITRKIPRFGPGRVLAWLFYTGSAGGVLWCCLLAGATVLWALIWGEATGAFTGFFPYSMWARSGLEQTLRMMGGIFLYAFCYCMLASLLRHVLFRGVARTFLPLVAALLMAAGLLLPILAAYLATGQTMDVERLPIGYLLASPIALTAYDPESQVVVWAFLIGWSLLMAALSAPWLVGQFQRFRPLQPAATAETSDQGGA